MARSHSEIYESADIEPHSYSIDDKSLMNCTCDGCGKRFLEVCDKSDDKLTIFEFWSDNTLAAFCSRQEAAHYILDYELKREERDERYSR